MSEKQKLIQEMIEMQKRFIAHEQTGGINLEEYYDEDKNTLLGGYQEKYTRLANKLVDMAHEEKGSAR